MSIGPLHHPSAGGNPGPWLIAFPAEQMKNGYEYEWFSARNHAAMKAAVRAGIIDVELER